MIALLAEYPEAVFSDGGMLDPKLYVQVLGCISVPPHDFFLANDEFGGRGGGSADNDTERAKIQRRCITTMFNLVHARSRLRAVVLRRRNRTKRWTTASPIMGGARMVRRSGGRR